MAEISRKTEITVDVTKDEAMNIVNGGVVSMTLNDGTVLNIKGYEFEEISQ